MAEDFSTKESHKQLSSSRRASEKRCPQAQATPSTSGRDGWRSIPVPLHPIPGGLLLCFGSASSASVLGFDVSVHIFNSLLS
ncbi:hypothetical protein BDV98DRAFT_143898 [Pterulicium gracile]|uniref:Uncharacterized protein n=1 Tax=Pterulicium gracile TaxID=1884261 RepID=A0A5C3QW65_9AGAR|nr:hypothetical protein BDV98DRAFT_143898 [Pterula gracilis]